MNGISMIPFSEVRSYIELFPPLDNYFRLDTVFDIMLHIDGIYVKDIHAEQEDKTKNERAKAKAKSMMPSQQSVNKPAKRIIVPRSRGR